MEKVILYRRNNQSPVQTLEEDWLTYEPGGWVPKREGLYLSSNGPKRTILPVEKQSAMIHTASWGDAANKFRKPSRDLETHIKTIDQQINDLKRQRAKVLEEEFMAMPLVEPSTLTPANLGRRYATKKEAENAKR